MSPYKRRMSSGEFVKRMGVWWFVLWGAMIALGIVSGLILHDRSLITIGLILLGVFVVLYVPFPRPRKRD
jgi:predicted branched-subunit amino acid permease